MTAPYPQKTVGFDNRLGWNDAISHYLEDIRLNRVAGNYQGWLNALWGVWDMGKTFLYSHADTVLKVDQLLDLAQRMIWKLESLQSLNDKNTAHGKKAVTYTINRSLSEAQVTAFKLMGDKGMFLPLRVPVENFDDKDAIEGAGMGFIDSTDTIESVWYAESDLPDKPVQPENQDG